MMFEASSSCFLFWISRFFAASMASWAFFEASSEPRPLSSFCNLLGSFQSNRRRDILDIKYEYIYICTWRGINTYIYIYIAFAVCLHMCTLTVPTYKTAIVMNIIDMYVVVFSRIACWRLLMSEPMSRFISSASCCNTTLAQSISKTPSKERADETWWDQGHQSEHYFERCKQTFHTLLSRIIERAHQQCEMRKRWTQVFFVHQLQMGELQVFIPKGCSTAHITKSHVHFLHHLGLKLSWTQAVLCDRILLILVEL